jgi:hypothetical protein
MKTPVLAFFAGLIVTATSFAVDPPPDGGYPGQNTAEGEDALFSLTTGTANTALGFEALYNNTSGNSNTAAGSSALHSNTIGTLNTAIGNTALFSNTTGAFNTAIGHTALYSNTSGNGNTGSGLGALYSNTTGGANTAAGFGAMGSNTTGYENTANGEAALYSNTTGNSNTANGALALGFNTTGGGNTATGYEALYHNTTGYANTAIGKDALLNNTSGTHNIAFGAGAGNKLTTGDNNIAIANQGVSGDANTIRIGTHGTHTATYVAGIRDSPLVHGAAVAVGISVDGRLGVRVSSARFKEAIRPMGKASEAILALKPVTFRYKQELDPEGVPQFGLVAEEVARIEPDLVTRDAKGKPYTVRYEEVNAMLLNEFLKEHKTVEEQATKIQQLESALKDVTARLDAKGL